MRVYEFSKKYGVPNKEVLDALHAGKFSIKSHMSQLDEDALNFLQKKFQLKSESSKAIKPTVHIQSEPKKALPKKIISEKVAQTKPVDAPEQQIKEAVVSEKADTQNILVLEPMSVGSAASKMKVFVNDMIITLLGWGIVANKNQILNIDIIGRLARHYGVPIATKEAKKEEFAAIDVEKSKLQSRLPVVVVMGHVDHGKTTLLDYIRHARVASREKGGITQHLGAYEAETAHGNIVFLDTPGHEAFSKIRMRGARIADIAILVVAADDSIKPQTVEAIKHAKAANIPIVVAINKIDKAEASQIERVKQDLSQHDLLPEDWGGEIVCVPISAKLGTNVDQLLEMIALQSQLMELQAETAGAAKGYVLEAKIEKGRGSVATLISRHGEVNIGDYFVCGSTFGRVSTLTDSYGKQLKKVGPSIPVQVAGFNALPNAGDFFKVVDKDTYRKARMASSGYQADAAKGMAQEGAINLIVKADSNLSKEALLESIEKLSKKFEKGFNIIHAGVGDINESDVILAANTGSAIYGMHVKAESNATSLSKRNAISISLFNIIYKLLEDLEKVAQKAKKVKFVLKKTGEAVVRKVFNVKGLGVIAGCYITDGVFSRNAIVMGWHGKQKLGKGKMKSLQRERKTVKEVHKGFECGFIVDEIEDWQEGDRAECYTEVPDIS